MRPEMERGPTRMLAKHPPRPAVTVVGQQLIAESMQPLSPSGHPQTGLGEMLHPGANDEVFPVPLDTRFPVLRRRAEEVVQGAWAQAHAEHIPEELGVL